MQGTAETPQAKKPNQKPQQDKAMKRFVKLKLPELLRKKIKQQKQIQDDSEGQIGWKPVSLDTLKASQSAKALSDQKGQAQKGKVLRLPPPKNNEPQQKPRTYSNSNQSKQPQVPIKLTEQQLKWDVYDQSFIKKQFEPRPVQSQPKFKQYNQEDDIDEAQMPEDFKGKTITTTIKKENLIDGDWRKKQIQRRTKLAVWEEAATKVSAVDRSKNQINSLLEDAMKRAEQMEYDLNKKAMERKNMKNRYGW